MEANLETEIIIENIEEVPSPEIQAEITRLAETDVVLNLDRISDQLELILNSLLKSF